MVPYIVFDQVSKGFGQETVLQDVSFQLEQGQIYGILGRNGAGKTVILKLLAGLLRPDGGRIFLNGQEMSQSNRFCPSAGVLIETPGFIPHYSGLKNLKVLNDLSSKRVSVKQLRAVMNLVGLDAKSPKPVKAYSLGMTQKLGLAQALMAEPDLLILDEPMNGLDDASVVQMRTLLLDCKAKGTTIFLASHNQEDIATLCDGLFRVREGQVVACEQVAP